jgi:hypothetical protein
MIPRSPVILSLVLLFAAARMFAQNNPDCDTGPDQILLNGIIYTYAAPPGAIGSQFLKSRFFIPGSVTIRGKKFDGISLNYDIYNQLLLYQFPDNTNPFNVIQISCAWLEEFSLEGMRFKYLVNGTRQEIYQVFGEGSLTLACQWRKTLDLDGAVGSYLFRFSDAKRDMFLVKDGQFISVNSNRGLLRCLTPPMQDEVRSFMKKNNIKINKSSDQLLGQLVIFMAQIDTK